MANCKRRKAKANLLEVELPHLQKLVRKGKTTPEIITEREARVRLECTHACWRCSRQATQLTHSLKQHAQL